ALRSRIPLTATPAIYTLSLHDALPILNRFHFKINGLFKRALYKTENVIPDPIRDFLFYIPNRDRLRNMTDCRQVRFEMAFSKIRSEEHKSELQSRFDLVCRLLLEQKKI